MNMAFNLIDQYGGAVEAVIAKGGMPENWPPSETAYFLSQLALELAEAEMERRKKDAKP
jgi:uncharacterized protein related to proFAR isomerase